MSPEKTMANVWHGTRLTGSGFMRSAFVYVQAVRNGDGIAWERRREGEGARWSDRTGERHTPCS